MKDHETFLAELVVEAMLQKDCASKALGMQVTSVHAGSACVSMMVRQDMINGFGTCHGGLLFTLADTAFGVACNSRNNRAVAASGQIEFLRAAHAGDLLSAFAVERQAGKRLGLYDVTITNQHEQTIALFRGRSCRITGHVVDETPTHS